MDSGVGFAKLCGGGMAGLTASVLVAVAAVAAPMVAAGMKMPT
jgi:hypothetical protein